MCSMAETASALAGNAATRTLLWAASLGLLGYGAMALWLWRLARPGGPRSRDAAWWSPRRVWYALALCVWLARAGVRLDWRFVGAVVRFHRRPDAQERQRQREHCQDRRRMVARAAAPPAAPHPAPYEDEETTA